MYISPVVIFFSLVIYLPVCLLLLYFLRKLQKKLGMNEKVIQLTRYFLLLLLFLVPTGEGILGKYNLDKYCDRDGGLYTSGDLPINSLYLKTPSPAMYPHSIRKLLGHGFEFFDVEADEQVYRYRFDEHGEISGELDANGMVLGEKVMENFSNYIVTRYHEGIQLPLRYPRIVERGLVLKNRSTGETVSGYRDYGFVSYLDVVIGFPLSGWNVACSTVARYREIPRYNSSLHDFYEFIASSKIQTEISK